jgi:hypothetical protein
MRFYEAIQPLETQDWEEVDDPDELDTSGDSYDFLNSVWRNPKLPLPTRINAAKVCVERDRPKLSKVNEDAIGERLDRAILRTANPRLNADNPEPKE